MDRLRQIIRDTWQFLKWLATDETSSWLRCAGAVIVCLLIALWFIMSDRRDQRDRQMSEREDE